MRYSIHVRAEPSVDIRGGRCAAFVILGAGYSKHYNRHNFTSVYLADSCQRNTAKLQSYLVDLCQHFIDEVTL